MDGYTSRKYIQAWQRVLQVYATGFPNQFISLTTGVALNINDLGKIDPGLCLRTTISMQAKRLNTSTPVL